MVAFDSRLKNSCPKTYSEDAATTPVTSPLNSDSGIGSESTTRILLTPQTHKNSHTKLLITTDSTSQPRKIGLNLNTNVHLKPKKRHDCSGKHIINEVLIFLLTVYGIMSYLEIRRLKEEVQVINLKMNILEDMIRADLKLFSNVIKRDHPKNVLREENEIAKHSVAKREAENVADVERAFSNCSSNARIARSVNRGPLALHLRGALPEITVRDGGIIAPWYIDRSSSGSFLLADGVVGERKGVLEVGEEGLYYIYAQIYYLTSASLNSYAVVVQVGEGRGREDGVVAACSAEAAVAKLSELSCFTATVRYLRRGDRLYVTQRERNRRIIFRDNHSFLGLVLLNANVNNTPGMRGHRE